jgi:hypothetical protein
MVYIPTESRLGVTSFTNKDTATAVPFGTIIRGQDPVLGGGEFIYLPGVASTEVGSLVTYNPVGVGASTTLCPHTANLAQPLAVAMSANTSTKNYGWYQIAGVAAVLKTATKVNPAVILYLSATAGAVSSTASAGKQLVNAHTVNAATVASGTSTVNTLIQRPFAQGAIT